MLKKFKFPKIVADFEHREHIILRDFLALERTTLANERTMFAYIRTSLYMVLAGVAFTELDRFEHMDWLGYLLITFSALTLIYGIIRYRKLTRRLRNFYRNIDFDEDGLNGKAES